MACRGQQVLLSTSGRTGGQPLAVLRRPCPRTRALPAPDTSAFDHAAAWAATSTTTPAPPLLVVPAPSIAVEVAAPRTAPPLSDAPSFEPRLSPAAAVACAAAAAPPIIFWARIFLNARKAVRDAEDKEAARLALLARIQGKGQGGGGA